jgi:glycosyltransferase involved in cell wall biosynthesis
MKDISIVVPIYNVETYLSETINSILETKIPNSEILLIDDGSTDNSGKISDRYAQISSDIIVYHKMNGGLSDARNYGIAKASGTWVVFIDGDDKVEKREFAVYCKFILNLSCDVIFNDYILCNSSNGSVVVSHQVEYNSDLEQVLSKSGQVWNVWRYTFRKEFILKNNLYFKKGYLAEDLDYIIRVISLPNLSIKLCHIPYYIYAYERNGSIMRTSSIRLLECSTEFIVQYYIELHKRKDRIAKLIVKKILRDYFFLVARIYQFDGTDRELVKSFFRRKEMPFRPLLFAPVLHILRIVFRRLKR